MAAKKKAVSKEEAFLHAILRLKVLACVTIWRFARWKLPPLSDELRRDLVAEVVGQLRVDAWPEQRLAAKVLLDIIAPGWESLAPDFAGEFVTRDSPAYRVWRKGVFDRDGGCVVCGVTHGLHAHHVVPWAQAPALRVEVANGVTLCAAHHVEQHRNMGRPMWLRLAAL